MGKMYLNGHLYGSGGGTEYVETELWSSSSGQEFYPSSPYTATLSDVITNYNLLAFTFSSITDTAFKFTTIVPVSVIDKSGTESFNTVVIGGNINNAPICYYVDDTHIAIAGWSSQNHMKIYSIIGIRCGATRKYSTNEQIVGTWIDGKPIYEKTIYDVGGRSGELLISHGISNLKRVISISGNAIDAYDSTLRCVPIPLVHQSGYNISFLETNSTACKLNIHSVYQNRIVDIYLTLQYTKTTD